jgi:septum formation protein
MTSSGARKTSTSGNAADLVLASASPYRRALLERLGLPFRSRAPLCDERSLKAGESNPVRLAEKLAHAKATSLIDRECKATIIGCDQVLSIENRILGKPFTIERAVEQLMTLSGRTHDLITAMVVIEGARVFAHTNVTKLQMRSLSRAEIERYVERNRPLDCAGSYKIEANGIALFEKIESDDESAITGLPLIALVSILRELGFEIP